MIILTDKMLVIPVGISPNYSGAGKSDIKIQASKDVTITENGSTTVVPDENFDVLTKVNITTDVNPALEDKSVEITANGDYNYNASAPYYGIGNFNVKVNVEVPTIETSKTTYPSFDEDVTVLPSEGFDAMSSVVVKKAEANLQDKTVDKASTSQIVLTADEGYQGLGTVTIAPINATAHTVNPSSQQQLITADTNNNEYIREVIVNGVPQKTLTADPSTKNQEFNSNHLDGEFYSKVVVNPVTSSIDSNIVPKNIAKGVRILGVTGNLEAGSTPGTPTEAYAIRQEYNNGYNLVYPINVRLTTDSWVSFDFAMSEQALEKYNMPILGVHNGALKLFIENGNLILETLGIERHINYKLDIARHNISFGFVNDVNPSNGYVRFKVEIDNNVMFNDYIVAPNFNLPLFLFGCPNEYHGTYEDYELLGGVTFLLNEIYISQSTEYYYIFGLKVYNVVNSSERNLIRDYEPAIDADQKPCLLEKLSNEYEYPSFGKFMYVSVPTAVPNEIANSDYGSETPQQCYVKPSAGAIVPTDIKLTPTTRIVMYTGDLGTFDEVSADATEEEILKSRVMVGAQPNLLISAYDENDIRRGLPGYAESHSISTDDLIWQMMGSKGIYFGGCSNILYSTSDTDGNSTQYVYGGDKLCFGYDVADPENANFDSDSLNKILNTNYDSNSTMPDYSNNNKKPVTPTYSQFNKEMNTPICFFGNYNETTMNANAIIALGYQKALSQIGYTTGIRYEIKRIEIYDRDSDGSISRKHMLLPAKDTNNKVLLYDAITEKSYYPFNGTLDVTSGTPTIQNIPVPPTILTDTYVKPSAGAIVPTDIKFKSLTYVKMYVKGFDNFEAEPDVDNRAMIGAQPNFIVSPYTAPPSTPGGIPNVGIYFKGCGNVIRSTETGLSISSDREHIFTAGYRPVDLNNFNIDTDTTMSKMLFIGAKYTDKKIGPTSTPIYKFVDDQARTPICIFGNYNNSESMTPDKVIALGYENALSQIGYVTGARYGVKQIIISYRNADGSETVAHSLVPARDTNNTICLYDTVANKSYYPFNGTLDVYTGPVEPEPPVTPEISQILTDIYVKPSADAIVPTDIKFTSLTNVTLRVKGFDNFEGQSNIESRAMIGSQPNFIISPFTINDSSIGLQFNGCGNTFNSTETMYDGNTPQTLTMNGEHAITVGYDPIDINNINMDTDVRMNKVIAIDSQGETKKFVGDTPTSIYKFVDDQARTPICIFGNYNNSESMTPDKVIALGYENALSQIGYVTGARYGVKEITINVRNADGSMTLTHAIVPAKDVNDNVLLYDLITKKSYYPFYGTLDII